MKDMQKIFLDEGLFLERTHEQQWFFTSLPEKAIPHAIDACAADITSADDMERMAVVIAIEPKKLTQLGYEVGVSK
ncbi:hypothetical protein KKG31_02740 [Patescibacteria group bacterium]|nr:hypothetical protein [Patescibacteria group bacterium]